LSWERLGREEGRESGRESGKEQILGATPKQREERKEERACLSWERLGREGGREGVREGGRVESHTKTKGGEEGGVSFLFLRRQKAREGRLGQA